MTDSAKPSFPELLTELADESSVPNGAPTDLGFWQMLLEQREETGVELFQSLSVFVQKQSVTLRCNDSEAERSK